jgi:hypothetical protein
MTSHGAPLDDAASVMRVIKVPVLNPTLRPQEGDFTLSSADKQERPPALSVWDRDLTTVQQAIAFTPPKETQRATAWALAVSAIRALRVQGLHDPSGADWFLDVIRSPLTDALTQQPDPRPGAHGHCGITGLDRPPGYNSNLFKMLRIKLVRCCTPCA